jgi:hypothetical protein
MRCANHTLASSVVTAAILLSSLAAAAGAQSGDKPAATPPGMDEAMMKRMMELATPGEHHKALDRFVGNWDATIKMWMGPGEPTVTKGSANYSWMLGGRYLQGKHTGDFGGMPFEGFGIEGYDNAQQRYFSVWFDTMGTGMMSLTGQPVAGGKGLDYSGTCFDPSVMKDIKVREEVRWKSDSEYTFTMFMEMPGPDGKLQEQRAMEMTSVRK